MASGTIRQPFVVYHKTIKGTTSAAGNISTGLGRNDYILVGAIANRSVSGYYSGAYNILVGGASNDTNPIYTITAVQPGTSQTVVLASTAVAIDIYYIQNHGVNAT